MGWEIFLSPWSPGDLRTIRRVRVHSRKQPGHNPREKTDQENRTQKFHECVTDRALENTTPLLHWNETLQQ